MRYRSCRKNFRLVLRPRSTDSETEPSCRLTFSTPAREHSPPENFCAPKREKTPSRRRRSLQQWRRDSFSWYAATPSNSAPSVLAAPWSRRCGTKAGRADGGDVIFFFHRGEL